MCAQLVPHVCSAIMHITTYVPRMRMTQLMSPHMCAVHNMWYLICIKYTTHTLNVDDAVLLIQNLMLMMLFFLFKSDIFIWFQLQSKSHFTKQMHGINGKYFAENMLG